MSRCWRTAAATVMVAGLALGAVYAATDGFHAVTSDGRRRADIASSPRVLPAIDLIDAQGQRLSLSDYAKPGTTTFVNLVYVRCQAVCLSSAGGHAWLQGELQARRLAGRVRLLTLSFDPTNDTPAVLADQARRLDADSTLWRFATVRRPKDVQAMLDLFGVIVLTDGLGGYTHNAALFLIGDDGLLRRAYDIERPDLALFDLLRAQGAI